MRCALCCFPVFLFLSPISSHVCFQATQGSQTAFHKDNIALLNRWSVHVLSVISIGLDTPRDRGDFLEHLEFFNKHIFKVLLLLLLLFGHLYIACLRSFFSIFLDRCEIATQKRDSLPLTIITINLIIEVWPFCIKVNHCCMCQRNRFVSLFKLHISCWVFFFRPALFVICSSVSWGMMCCS